MNKFYRYAHPKNRKLKTRFKPEFTNLTQLEDRIAYRSNDRSTAMYNRQFEKDMGVWDEMPEVLSQWIKPC